MNRLLNVLEIPHDPIEPPSPTSHTSYRSLARVAYERICCNKNGGDRRTCFTSFCDHAPHLIYQNGGCPVAFTSGDWCSTSTYIQNQPKTELFSSESALFIKNVVDVSKEPLRKFLQKNTTRNHTVYFYKLAYSKFPQEYKKNLSNQDFIVLIPAFITSQLKGAFEIGVLIYLPFFVIDLVTSNILLAMGMMMLSPLTIALPLKLLLLVMVDGWTLIIQGIVQTYK